PHLVHFVNDTHRLCLSPRCSRCPRKASPAMLMALSGPTQPPLAGGAPRRLVILLHGLGADGNDLIGLSQYWGPLVPDAEFVSPNAPFPCDMAPWGYQWFSVQDRSPAAV